MCVLRLPGPETLLVTAGEDTTLRLHALSHPGHLRPLGVLRSHLSGVRALCVVEGLGVIEEKSEKDEKGSELRGQIVEGTEDDDARIVEDSKRKGCIEEDDSDDEDVKDNDKRQMVDRTPDNESNATGKTDAAKDDEDRQLKKGRMTDDAQSNDTKSLGFHNNGKDNEDMRQEKGVDDLQDNNTNEDNNARERRRTQQAAGTTTPNGTVWMVSAGGRAELKIWHCAVNTNSTSALDPCSTHTHTQGQMRRGVEGQGGNLSVTCQEVESHMLRTGSHKTWRNQQLTFDPETRYMAAAGFWVTSSVALVALASSDGFLRLDFLFVDVNNR